ncbi:protein TonB [Raoultella sp. BIGb0138]|uniref:energy transducer TonB n=1 Tax=Raoultella sp. BIGb0138 TaxID=2485115 RepID=UPI00104F52A5|nr:energy transducer TonB [Raoultella sp. BIGb0138]TCW06476.1 protein TonB [Raoultella sp. BIGb0138]
MLNKNALSAAPLFPQGWERGAGRRWTFAGLLTLLLHVMLLGWLCYQSSPPPPLPAAAPMVVLMLSSQTRSVASPEKMPTGVLQTHSLPSSRPVAQKEEAKEESRPALTQAPQGTEPKTPPAVKKSKPAKRKDPTPPKTTTEREAMPSKTPPAPDTSAPPSMNDKQVAAPQNMAAAQANPMSSDWSGQLLAHLSRFKRYPAVALRQQRQGVVYISITLDRQGNVLMAKLLRSSGVDSLDHEAEQLAKRATPLPAPPDDIRAGQPSFSVTLPIRFDLREARR